MSWCAWMHTVTQPLYLRGCNGCRILECSVLIENWTILLFCKRSFNHIYLVRIILVRLIVCALKICPFPAQLCSAVFFFFFVPSAAETDRQNTAHCICTSCVAHIETSCLPVSLSVTYTWAQAALLESHLSRKNSHMHTHTHKPALTWKGLLSHKQC